MEQNEHSCPTNITHNHHINGKPIMPKQKLNNACAVHAAYHRYAASLTDAL